MGPLVITLIIAFCIFLILRELMCWYYKINTIVSNQDEIIKLLRKIAGEDEYSDGKVPEYLYKPGEFVVTDSTPKEEVLKPMGEYTEEPTRDKNETTS